MVLLRLYQIVKFLIYLLRNLCGKGMCAVQVDAMHRVMHGSLPQVLSCILGDVPVADVCRVSTVCREWNKLANDNQLWKGLCHRDGIMHQQLTLNQMDLQHGCYYKCLYKKYATVMKRWMSGEGVTTFTNALLTPTGAQMRGYCDVISSRYILVDSKQKRDSNIYVYSAVTGDYSHMLSGLTGHPETVLLSDDELMVAAYSWKSSVVCVWEVQTAECLHPLDHPYNVQSIAMHNTTLAVGFSGGVFVWNVHNGQSLHRLVGLDSADELVLDSDNLAMYSEDGRMLRLWNITTGVPLLTYNHTGVVAKCQMLLLLDTGTHSFICHDGRKCYVWDTEMGTCRTIIFHYYEDNAVRQEDTVIICCADDGLMLYDDFDDALVQDGKLIIACSFLRKDGIHCHSILVIDLKSSSILCRVIGLPFEFELDIVKEECTTTMIAAVSKLPGFILMYSNVEESTEYQGLYLYDVQREKFVRDVNEEHGGGLVSKCNASFKMLQLVKEVDDCLTYVRYDFDA